MNIRLASLVLVLISASTTAASFLLSYFDINLFVVDAIAAIATVLTACIYIVFTHAKIYKIQNQIIGNNLAKTNQVNDMQLEDLDLIQGTILRFYAEKAALLKNIDALKSEINTIESSCNESIGQAQEASRLAEESRIKNLLSASSKLETVVQDILSSAGQISNQMESISSGAETQKNRMSETMTAMDEMNVAIRDISHSTSDASVSIDRTKENAIESAQISSGAVIAIAKVNESTTTLKENMGDLSTQAQNIDNIMNVISDIADQTNLLALNAAIEAARAGDAGRGFAVVADEVRKLAEKTMQATKEVGATISSIQNSVQMNIDQMVNAVKCAEEATQMAQKAGNSAEAIKHYAEENTMKIHSIATASEEQSATSSHINDAISEVGQVAVLISDGINESTQAVLVLSDLAKELSVLIADLKSGMEMNILMPWTSQLATGVKFVDEQHRKLVDMINNLYKAMQTGQGKAVVEKLLDDLANYTVYHFDAEEKIFHKLHYSETAGHIKIHEELKSKVMSFINEYKSGSKNISMDLMNFLKNWLENHICKTDKRYVKTFLGAGIEPTSM
ncbi:bacteriohemerythrin [Solidesulfovibrio magneticus]|uniref:Methyl-accepting chemotaxis protein n=1 Tax=Solidesulfovibrio magneticus (strain ATCC 700980 / DSM 13731 / RS-1) TaxID=573370 RepID=C4XM19_SOLM1|nr:bacteriohemerythrin [Solidesulfovibrio magneticus]BAH77147.1 putative methyl-accepting chemotaxis protein [Solidesulfovibrio magneticus RS-1]